MKLLDKKVAIVTGAARGIGEAIARKFAEHGASVAFTYVSDSSAEKAVKLEKDLTAMGVKAKGYKSNASDFAQCESFVNDVLKEFGTVDICVNNAGISKDNLLLRMARYGRLRSRKNEIQAAIDSLSKLPNSVQVAKLKQNLNNVATELNDALTAMDKWMEEFNMDSAVNNMEQRINYLMSEKLKIGKVKDAMMKGLQEADSTLTSLKL